MTRVHSDAVGVSIPGGDLSALIARLEAAEAGSAELDYLIREEFSEWRNIGGGWAAHKVTGERRCNHFDGAAPVTTSLDAALALAERVLPGWNWCVARDAGASEAARFRAWVQSEEDRRANPLGLSSDAAPTPALALCIAILKAVAQAPAEAA